MRKVDVAIIGGGFAGNLLARHLRRSLPDVSVALFERDHERAYKVGESTVEIATQYFQRKVGLSSYLYKEHLPKNGLRFFFDTEDKDGELHRLSEIGVHALPPYPSYQLDRARLERDLLDMNRRDGVDVHVGARVTDLELSEDGGTHTFSVKGGDAAGPWQARWLIDASGRAGTIPRHRNLRVPEKEHRMAAAWGRFSGVQDIDDLGPPEWRSRVRYTARMLSTNHFAYPGYWIWFIPLREGLTSVGVVSESSGWDVARHKPEGLRAFLDQHGGPRTLLEGSELVDIGAFTHLAFRTKQFFSGQRWGLIGDAAAFSDPFYSPGSDFIAVENDMLVDLIGRDVAGEDIGERTEIYDRYMHHRFDLTMVIYQGLYGALGSYELMRAKAYFDTSCYYNLLFDSYARDEHLDLKWLRSSLRRADLVLETMRSFGRLFSGATRELHRRGTYFRGNLDNYLVDGRKAFGVMESVGEPRSRREVNARNLEIFDKAQCMVRDVLDGDPGELKVQMDSLFDAWSALQPSA